MTKMKVEIEKIDNVVQKLSQELQQGESDYFKEYLRFASKFHKYSLRNQILISIQNPNATRVASFVAWKKLGRHVKKGEKAIKILVPWIKNRNEDKGEEKALVGFGLGNVFDISQTEGQEIPAFFYDLGDDGLPFYNTLKEVMQKRGIVVDEKELGGGTQGISYGGRVEILSSLDGTNKALTLIHEFAHEIMHKGSENATIPRGVKECQAEAVAYIVGNYLGLESPISRDYLINWGNSVDTLKDQLGVVVKTSQAIIEMIVSADKDVQKEPELEAVAA